MASLTIICRFNFKLLPRFSMHFHTEGGWEVGGNSASGYHKTAIMIMENSTKKKRQQETRLKNTNKRLENVL